MNEDSKSETKGGCVSLQNAKKYLQRGEITEVRMEVGISSQQASNVMGGRSTNWAFVEKILDRAEKNKALIERARRI